MTLSDILRQAQKFSVDNSPTILTALGVTGTVTTAFLAGRLSYNLGYHIAQRDEIRGLRGAKPLTRKEIAKEYWSSYIGPVASGTATIACIVGANHISSKRTAAVATAYALSERAFSEYKEKVVEKIGSGKEERVRTEIAQDRVLSEPPPVNLVSTDTGEVLCCDSLSMRYFMSSMENVRRAQNDINDQIIRYNYATLADFYDALGLKPTSLSHDMGWNHDNMLRISFSAVLTEDKRPCMYIEYATVPIRDYFQPR